MSQARREVTGTTGLRIIRAILAGERDPHPRAAFRNSRCQKDAAEIARALTGTWRDEPLFVLKPALALCDLYPAQLSACDPQIERAFAVMRPRFAPAPETAGLPCPPGPPRRQPHAHSTTAPAGHTRAPILRIPGGDLVAVHGSSDSLAQTLRADMGTDMRKGPDAKQFCSWLGLAPQHAIAGGPGLKSRTMKNRPRAAQAFRLAAQSVVRAPCAFGAFSRRLPGRLGPAQALVATAQKIARAVYHMLKHRVPSHDIGAAE